MTLRVSGKNLDIGLAFRTHIETRIDSALTKYRARLVAGHVTVEPEGSGFRADCTLHLSSGATMQADAKAQEPYASFNRAADLIENQIRRHRERLLDHHASAPSDERPPIGQPHPNGSGADRKPSLAGAGEAHDLHPAVIAEPSSGYREMTVSGAAMELDSTNAQSWSFVALPTGEQMSYTAAPTETSAGSTLAGNESDRGDARMVRCRSRSSTIHSFVPIADLDRIASNHAAHRIDHPRGGCPLAQGEHEETRASRTERTGRTDLRP